MTTLKAIGLVIGGVVIGYLASLAVAGGTFGGAYHTSAGYFGQGLYAGQGNEFSVDTDGDIRLTKSTFCMNFYATSTATLVKMTASSTATVDGVDGVMVMQYGAC